MSDNGATDATDLNESWDQFYSTLCSLPEELDELSDRLRDLLPSANGGTLEEPPDDLKEYLSELLTTARDATEELHEQAETLHTQQLSLADGAADPLSIIQRVSGDSYKDDYAREVWQDHQGCTVAELESIARKLSDVQEATRSRIANKFKAGEQPSERHLNAFAEAYYRWPIIDYMAERAALDGPEPPGWNQVRWQGRVQMTLSGRNACHDALRVIYFLLVQRNQQFESIRDLHAKAGEVMGKTRTAVANGLGRARDRGTPAALKDWTELPDSVDGYRNWMREHPGLEIDV